LGSLQTLEVKQIYFPLEFLGKKVREVSCSKSHTLLLTTDGIVFGGGVMRIFNLVWLGWGGLGVRVLAGILGGGKMALWVSL
jgi:hypothetical protein